MANETGVEQAMRAACDALMAGDVMTAMGFLTPQALMEAMTMSAGITSMPSPSGYVIDSHEESDGEHRFRVRFQTSEGDKGAQVAWREVEGAWKITTLKLGED